MAGAEFSTVTPGIEKHGAPVERPMKTDYEPERAGASNREAAEKAQEASACKVFPPFIRFVEIMLCAKTNRKQDGRWPKPDAIGERSQHVTSVVDFFRSTSHNCGYEPQGIKPTSKLPCMARPFMR